MADYNLGTARGTVRIDYDNRGTEQAEQSLNNYRDAQGRLRDENGRFVKESTQGFRQVSGEIKNTEHSLRGVGNALRAISKVPIMAGVATTILDFTAAVTPALGLAAALPGVLGAAAGSMAVVQIATSGMGDALSAVAEGDAKKLAEAMQKLSPEAQQVVRQYQTMKPALDAIKLDVQNSFWRENAEVLGQVGRAYLPTVHHGLVEISEEMGNMLAFSMRAIMEPDVVAATNVILENTAALWRELGAAPGHFTAALTHMGAVGSQYLPAFGEWLGGMALQFRNWAASAEGQAQINIWIQEGVRTVQQLWQILVNLGSIASGIFSALSTDGQSFLETMVGLTEAAATWVNSAEGQSTINGLFILFRDVLTKVFEVMTPIAMVVDQLSVAYNSLSQPMRDVVASGIAWAGVLGMIIGYAAPVVGFLTEHWATITRVVQVSGQAIRIIGLVGKTALLMAADIGMAALRIAASWLVAMGPIGWIILAVAALATLIYFYWDEIKAFTIAAWTAISTWVSTKWSEFLTWATTFFQPVVNFFNTIWTSVQNTWNTIWTAIADFVRPIWQGIIAFIQGAWEIIKNIFIFVAAVLLAIFFTIWNPLYEVTLSIWNTITAFLKSAWDTISSTATQVWNKIVSIHTAAWNAIIAFVTPIVQSVLAVIVSVWNTIKSTTSAVWDAICNAVKAAWDAIYNFVAPKVEAVWSVISSIWTRASSETSSVWNTISSAISTAWNTIYGYISSGVNRAWEAIVGWGNKVKGLASEAINWLVNAGRSLVTGLWNGIVAMGSWLYNRIMSWVRSVVPAPILTFLGISSPSKYMEKEVGEAIAPGVAKGIENKSAVAQRAAAEMAKDVGNSAKIAAAEELLAAVNSGVLIEEDLSFRGMSKNMTAMNHALADSFYQMGQKFDKTTAQGDLKEFLTAYVAAARTPTMTTASLPPAAQDRMSALASSSQAASASTTPSATVTAASAASVGTGSTVINIGTFALSVEGNLDPTDPVRWRQAMESIRAGLTQVEATYR